MPSLLDYVAVVPEKVVDAPLPAPEGAGSQ
jgi:hypothetical protein